MVIAPLAASIHILLLTWVTALGWTIVTDSGNMSRTSRLRSSHLLPGFHRDTSADVTIPMDVGVGRGPNAYATAAAVNANATTTTTAEQDAAAPKKKGKQGETLFGPDLGLDDQDAPGWTSHSETMTHVPLSTVKQWVQAAKQEDQGVHQTTTLQALVNLKRPTLTLVPLPPANQAEQMERIEQAIDEDDSSSHDHYVVRHPHHKSIRHTLRFKYDASCPLVRITISVHPRFSNHGQSRTITTSTVPGGFGKSWEIPPEHAIDIGQAILDEKRAEQEHKQQQQQLDGDGSEGSDGDDELKKPGYGGMDSSPVVPRINRTATAAPATALANSSSTTAVDSTASAAAPDQPKKGFFDRLKRNKRPNVDLEQGNGGQASGGADVVEMQTVTPATHEPPAVAATTTTANETPDESAQEEQGIRLVVRLDALRSDGSSLAVTNAQATHVLLGGMTVGEHAAQSGDPAGASSDQHGADEEKRIWFIKVVRREAIVSLPFSDLIIDSTKLRWFMCADWPTCIPSQGDLWSCLVFHQRYRHLGPYSCGSHDDDDRGDS